MLLPGILYSMILGRTAALTGSTFELGELHSRIQFRCYGKRSSLVRVRARSTIVLDRLSSAMVNGRGWI